MNIRGKRHIVNIGDLLGVVDGVHPLRPQLLSLGESNELSLPVHRKPEPIGELDSGDFRNPSMIVTVSAERMHIPFHLLSVDCRARAQLSEWTH